MVERALLFSKLVKSSEKLAAESVLDVGCRDGFALVALESELENARIVGIDIVPEFVESARALANEVYEMDAHALTFADREFDYVFSSHTLEHCYSPERALKEMKRVASKGLYLALPIETPAHTDINHAHYFSTVDPLVWANMVADETWMVTGVEMSDFCDVIITAMPRECLTFEAPHL